MTYGCHEDALQAFAIGQVGGGIVREEQPDRDLGIGWHLLADVDVQEGVRPPVRVELSGQGSEHVRIEVHPSRRRPVLGVWNDERAVTAAAPLYDEYLAPLIHGVEVGKLAVEPEVRRPS